MIYRKTFAIRPTESHNYIVEFAILRQFFYRAKLPFRCGCFKNFKKFQKQNSIFLGHRYFRRSPSTEAVYKSNNKGQSCDRKVFETSREPTLIREPATVLSRPTFLRGRAFRLIVSVTRPLEVIRWRRDTWH